MTIAQDVFDSFESCFQDKTIIPQSLEIQWLKKAVARFSMELDPIVFHVDTLTFENTLSQYAIDTLAYFMWEMYQAREVSKVNKRVRIVSKDMSIDGGDGTKKYAAEELARISESARQYVQNQKPTAYR